MFEVLQNSLFGTKEKKQLVWNIYSLGFLQVANYLLPLVTMPYLVRVLGPENYGFLAFVSATITYFMLITDYGFNLSATRQISISRNDKNEINKIFNSVMVIKTVLLVLSFIILCIGVFSFTKFSRNWEVYFLTFGMVFGQVLFPVWLFQGMEKMKFVTYLNLASKIFFTICIFIFVRNQHDFVYVPLLNSLGFIVIGIWSLFLVKKEFNIIFFWPSQRSIKYQLEEGWHIFLSSIAKSLYTISITFFLGLFTGNLVVGYFSAADKIVQAIKGLYQPISQAIYPMVGKLIHDDKQAGIKFICRTTLLVGSVMLLVSILLFLLADPIVNFLLGEQYHQSILLLKIMSGLPFVIVLSNMFGVQIMLNMGYKKAFSGILTAAAILGVGLIFVTIPAYESVGASLIMLIIEIFVTVSMFIYLKKILNFD